MEALLQNSLALRLLYKLVTGQISEIHAKVTANRVTYPSLRELESSDEEAAQLLEKLGEEGFLHRKVSDNIFKCPQCFSADIRPQLLCPKCKSADYTEGNVLVHYSCSYIDFEEKFWKEASSVRCPRCNRVLRQIGVDYGNPGMAFKCLECGEFFHLPFERWVCKVCDRSFRPTEARRENVYSYRFNEARRNEVRKALLYVEPMAEALKRGGFSVECFYELEGKSGSFHMFDIVAKNSGPSRRELIVEVEEKGGLTVTVDDLLKFLAKFFDVKTKGFHGIFVAIPKLEREARVFASKFRVECLEAGNMEDAVDQLRKIIGL
ncbi:hypothetical protein [Candidatus Hecatella orcuttiae]|uniref:TackOD1 domain-containing metal-binding protein n=1 Tax=Candidatus Hecatella orcuttiae TaxID=1935119 RepID=UPI002867EA46|nr:hypothetical protein [Candidatus Hecatella orcuttiae]